MSAITPDCRASSDSIRQHLEQTLELHIAPSLKLWRYQFVATGVLVILTLLTLLTSLAFGWALLAGVCVISLLAVVHLLRYRRWEFSQQGLLQIGNTGWQWQQASGCERVQVAGDITLWPGLIVLPLKSQSGSFRVTLVLLPDSANRDQQRRLRVRLKTRHW